MSLLNTVEDLSLPKRFIDQNIAGFDGLTSTQRAMNSFNSEEANKQRQFDAGENQKSRDFTANENALDRAFNSEEARKNREEGITSQIAQYEKAGINPYAFLQSGFGGMSNSSANNNGDTNSSSSSGGTTRTAQNGTTSLRSLGNFMRDLAKFAKTLGVGTNIPPSAGSKTTGNPYSAGFALANSGVRYKTGPVKTEYYNSYQKSISGNKGALPHYDYEWFTTGPKASSVYKGVHYGNYWNTVW